MAAKGTKYFYTNLAAIMITLLTTQTNDVLFT